MKKVKTLMLIGFLFFNAYSFARANDSFDIKRETTAELIKVYDFVGYFCFDGYVIKNNHLYVKLSLDIGEEKFKKKLYRYENKQFREMILDEDEMKRYWDDKTSVERYNFENNKIIIDENKYIEFTPISLEHWLRISLVNNGSKNEQKKYVCILSDIGGYAYFDRKNLKLYFVGFNKETSGLYVYDVNKNEIDDFKVNKINSIEDKGVADPIRIPNTPYLLYHTLNIGLKPTKYNPEKFEEAKGIEFWIQEIPEWKAEIEAKDKEKQISDEIKYVIDGPANIREKAKGKQVIGSVEDGIEVTILEKKGDWYKIKKEKIEGWTYKDNIKEIKE